MKQFKKLTAVACAAVLALSLAACGGSSSQGTGASSGGSSDQSASSESADKEKIIFGTNAEFPPFEFVASNGGLIEDYDGIDIAIVKEVGETLGVDVAINNMEFDSLLIALENGQIDAAIAGMTVTEERKKSVNFTTPYYTATQVMITKEGAGIEKAADMEGKTIAVIQGYTGEICVQDLGFEYESFKKGTDAVLELINGKADVVVIDSATAAKYVADNEGLTIVEDPDEFADEEYAIAVSKDNEKLLGQLNGVIEKMLAAGTIAELGDKYAVAEE